MRQKTRTQNERWAGAPWIHVANMKPEEIVAFFAHRVEAYARHDNGQPASTHAEDGVLLSPTGGTIVGREAIEKVYRLPFSAFPDLRMDVEDLVIAGDQVVQRVTVSGTDVGGFLGNPVTGRRVRVAGAFFHAEEWFGNSRAAHP